VPNFFDETVSILLIPKQNMSKINAWADILLRMTVTTIGFFLEYYNRNISENGFSSGKGKFERIVKQKRDGRHDIALFSNAFLHNLSSIWITPK
jgi:transposase